MKAVAKIKSFEWNPSNRTAAAGAIPLPAIEHANGSDARSKEIKSTFFSFDVRKLLDRVEGDRGMLHSTVRSFSVQWLMILKEISGAELRRDSASVCILANRIKLSLRSIGAGQGKMLAEKLEEAGRNRKFHEIRSHSESLNGAIDQLLDELRDYCEASGA